MNKSNYRPGCSDRSNFSKKIFFRTMGVSLLGLAMSLAATAQVSSGKHDRDIDKRLLTAPLISAPTPGSEQQQSLATMRRDQPGIMARFNEYGVTSSLTNPTGPVASAVPSASGPEATARSFLAGNLPLLGLETADIEGMALTDVVKSISGVTHYYFGQTLKGIPVYNGQLQVHVTEAGAISHVNNAFIPKLAAAVGAMTPRIGPDKAIAAAARELNINLSQQPELVRQLTDAQATSVLRQAQLAPQPIKAKLVLVPMWPGHVALAWNFQFQMDHAWPDITVNAETGELITSFDMMRDTAFRVYAEPVESPIHTTPLPPADARTLVMDPEDAIASPQGWFDGTSTLMDGNNVHACADRNGNNSCDSPQPNCGAGQVCDFPLDLSGNPANSLSAAIANLFYWNNHIHDVQYQYGFDEVGGNFQENNFGRGGAGSDSVNAEAQDNANGGSNCNANFATPTDGGNPRMQMFLCNRGNPSRDGDFDNGVIVHEYGHGISIRQVGGPGNSSCLNNRQQGGEGWSDWFGLVYTAKASDQATDPRGLGAYLFALAPDGTIRPQQYSTDPAINNYTYESVRGSVVPHGVGSVWAQALWEVYWALVDKHGFEGDLLNFDINDANEAGNKRALFYVNEGLKNTACSPTFVAARDGIIAAVNNSFGGEDVCTVWQAFAAFGLGVNAVSGGSNSTSPTNGFNLPAQCDGTPPPVLTCADGSDPLYVADFEADAGGWVGGSSSCTTGAFVRGTPTLQADGGVTTQVGGAASGNGAWFTATNTAAGSNDVDGGTCETLSPAVDLSALQAADISLSYFHGQRDGGDDASDGFSIEVLNNGVLAATMVNIGDVTTNAAWTAASSVINNPGTVQLRVRATDGAAGGDLIEGGVDKVLFCASGPVTGGCSVEEGFESGAGGWSNSSASSCTTGAFVTGTPTAQSNGGVTTQVGGANSGSGALFTATNSSAGVNDVDGGNCIVGSPTYGVSEASTLSVAYFHGQRDSGDDAGDFFRLQVSTDGGSTFTTLADNGDVLSNAAWQTVTAPVAAGANVVLQVQCADGVADGDLVECGIDDVSICPTN
ncbi:M36 family metallopeptidase [Exilibacterium tricleocarpae]|nr:M36 family metallopeptidase [Exilibacterium tricleocarpae]